MTGPIRTTLMLLSIVVGILIPQAFVLSFLIRYFLMGMLFFAFLDLQISKEIVAVNHIYMIIYLVAISFLAYFIGSLIDMNLALALFITGIAPTAISAAPVISFLKGNVGYVTFAVLLTNIVIAVLLPFILPFVLITNTEISVSHLVFPVMSVIFIPLILALLVRKISPKTVLALRKVSNLSFFFFISNIFFAMASASNYLTNNFNHSFDILLYLAVGIFILTAMNFTFGWKIGGKRYAQETSNAIGQKNTMFAIWVALTFINPVVALGPMMYTVYHNLFVSYQLYKS